MNKLTVQQTAEKWNISVRRVQDYCRQGKIPGAQRIGTNWLIPADAIRPMDGRKKAAKEEADKDIPMPRKCPFLYMTDLYPEAGTADKCILSLSGQPEAQALFAAEIAYSRGEIDKVYRYATYFLEKHSSFYAVLAGGMLLAQCALWAGDINMWQLARKHICEAHARSNTDRDIISLSLGVIDSAIRSTQDFPKWFKSGWFENLPVDAHYAAKIYYVKHLIVTAQQLASGEIKYPDLRGLSLMRSIPYVVEPMIADAVADKVILVEIYLRLLCAIACHQVGNTDRAILHLDKAIEDCLEDGLYGPLVEHRRQLGGILDERLSAADPEAFKKVKELYKRMQTGWTTIHNAVLERTVSASLTIREREIARLAVFGLNDKQIANRFNITENAVKNIIDAAKEKTGVTNRGDLAFYI